MMRREVGLDLSLPGSRSSSPKRKFVTTCSEGGCENRSLMAFNACQGAQVREVRRSCLDVIRSLPSPMFVFERSELQVLFCRRQTANFRRIQFEAPPRLSEPRRKHIAVHFRTSDATRPSRTRPPARSQGRDPGAYHLNSRVQHREYLLREERVTHEMEEDVRFLEIFFARLDEIAVLCPVTRKPHLEDTASNTSTTEFP